MENKRVIVTKDAVIEEEYLIANQIACAQQNEEEHARRIESIEQNKGLILISKGVGFLNLIKSITKNTAQLLEGEIMICNDSKKLLRKIEKEVLKESDCAQEVDNAIKGILCYHAKYIFNNSSVIQIDYTYEF